jgi:riboflavin kinase / FMN adenylyltransferase
VNGRDGFGPGRPSPRSSWFGRGREQRGQRIDGADQLLPKPPGTLVLVGNFDGVHRGHQWVLERGIELAEERGLVPLVLTFDPHPSVVLGRGTRAVLTPLDRKVDLLTRLSEQLGVVVERFTPELAGASPREFARDLLQSKLAARLVTVGQNFRFGRGRAGDAATLAALGVELGFEARAEVLHGDEGGAISSTRIRDLISTGEVVAAEQLLGRPHALSGVVEPGEQMARRLGIPSANLGAVSELLPAPGIYAVLVDVLEGSSYRRLAPGVANVGVRPTLGAGELKVEVHALGFSGDLYGRSRRAHFVARLRDEVRFDGIEALRAQLDQDKLDAAARLASRVPDPAAGDAWH